MADKSFHSSLKKNSFLRRRVKAIKNYKEFMGDAADFNRYYIEKAELKGDYSYRLMLLVHSVEKGLCSNKPRAFGKSKAKQIAEILKSSPEKAEEFEYALGISALKAWKAFHDEHGYDIPEDLYQYINNLKTIDGAGCSLFKKEKSFFGRRSVRDFENREISSEDIDYALKFFQAAPTACNRQMCSVYRVKSEEAKRLLIEKIMGISGFNTEAVTFFLITFDIASLDYFGERNQGYLNVGLTAMNFANALHQKGIGSCFLQWSNKRRDDKAVREKLGLKKSERIGVVIGAGYYKENVKTPNSVRKPILQIYKEI